METLSDALVMHPSKRHTAAGFTLLELLVALAITGAAVALVFATYGIIARTEQRTQLVINRVDQMQAVHDWLQSKLEGIRVYNRIASGVSILYFNGNAAGALWVAPLPERGPGGGLHVVRVDINRSPDGQVDWVAEALPYEGALNQLDWSQSIRTMLAKDLVTLQWHYLDGKTGTWVQDWPSTRPYYPSRVRIEIADRQGAWPPLIFALPRAR